MRVGISSSCAIGLAMALLLGAAPNARGQQQDPPRRTTSSRRIPVTKDRPATERPRTATIRVNQDSIAAADAARQDSIAHAHDRVRSSEELRVARSRNSGFYMGIAGGSTMAMGDLKTADVFDMGWNVTVPFGWDFSRIPLGIRFDVAMDNLLAKSTIMDPFGNPMRNVVVYSGSGGLKLNVPLFRTASRFYLIGGAGAHRITGYATATDSVQTIMKAKTDIGWYGGAGFNFRFGRTALFIESRYINVDNKQPSSGFAIDKVNYLPVILGFQF